MNFRRLMFWLLCALSIVFAVRGFYGVVAGYSFSKGRSLAAIGEHERALPLLDRAVVGELGPEARWFAAEVRLGLWQERIESGADPEDVAPLLSEAFVHASAALAASPASGWYWMLMGNLYHQADRLSIHRRGVPLDLVGQDRWNFVGGPGRIAIGMMRIGLSREPNWYPFHDQLAYVYYDYRLEAETLEAVYRSALALPIYELHAYRSLQPPEPEIEDAFARGAVDSLGKVPWLRSVLHRIALGRLEVRRENWIEAETHLRIALSDATVELNIAEINHYLGVSLIAQERFDEAREALTIAESEPPIEPQAVAAQADLAERLEDWSRATDLWQRAKRLAPQRPDVPLRLARSARRDGQTELAVHTLREAQRTNPKSRVLLIELAEVFIERGDESKVRALLGDLERLNPEDPMVERLRQRLNTERLAYPD